MSETVSLEAQIADARREAGAPFKRILSLVRANRERLERELEITRRDERELVRALRAMDPTFEPVTKPGPKANHKKSTPATWRNLSESSLESLTKWITENRERLPKVFNGKDLTDLEFYNLQRTDVAARLAVLADRGVIRLDHVGRGSVKFYAVVGPTN